MNKLKRALCAGMSCLLALSALCGCGSGGGLILSDEDVKEPVAEKKLTFFGYKAGAVNVVAIESALRGYVESRNDVNVIYESVEDKFAHYLGLRAKAGVLDDIFMLPSESVFTLEGPNGENVLAALNDVAGIDGFNEYAKAQFSNGDGSVRFLPTCIAVYGLFVNYDLLKAHNQSVPRNYAEFTATCDYFLGKDITPIVTNNGSGLSVLVCARAFASLYAGGNAADKIEQLSGDYGALRDTLQPGLELAADFLGKGYIDAREALQTSQTHGDAELFNKGDRPFMITGSWVYPLTSTDRPAFSYGVCPFPVLDTQGDGNVLVTVPDSCLALNANGEYLSEAKEFLSYIANPDVIYNYCDNQNGFTPMIDKRLPSDRSMASVTPYYEQGKSVVFSDFRWKTPFYSALEVGCDSLLNAKAQGSSPSAHAAAEVILNYLNTKNGGKL